MTGAAIRRFFTELLGSRVAARAEDELLRLREDYESRLQEKDQLLAELRERIRQMEGKLAHWETIIIPLTSPAGNLLFPKPHPPTFDSIIDTPESWSAIQAREEALLQKQYDEEMASAKGDKNGI